LNSQNNYVEIM